MAETVWDIPRPYFAARVDRSPLPGGAFPAFELHVPGVVEALCWYAREEHGSRIARALKFAETPALTRDQPAAEQVLQQIAGCLALLALSELGERREVAVAARHLLKAIAALGGLIETDIRVEVEAAVP